MPAVLLPFNTNSTIYFPLVGSGTAAFSTAGTGSLVGTNVLVSKDGGAFATSTNTGTHLGSGLYQLVLTTSELSAKWVAVYVGLGTLGTVVEHQAVFIQTYGSASAMYGFDFGTMLSSQTVGTVTTVLGGTIGTITGTPLVNLVANQATATIGTVAFVATGTITAVTGAVTITGTPAVDMTKILGTAVVGTQGTLTNIGTAGTVLGTQLANLVANQAGATIGTVLTLIGIASANVLQWIGTAVPGTQGTALVNLVADQSAATIGVALSVTNAVTVTGTPVVDITKLKGTAIAGTQGTLITTVSTIALTELTQGQPSATPSMHDALMALYMALRNPGSSDGTWKTVSNSTGPVIFKKSLADNGTVYTEGSATAGP